MAAESGNDTGSGSFGFLTHKVGPLPVWAWAAIAVGAWYWYTHFGPGANKAVTGHTTTTEKVTVTPVGGSQYKTNEEWEAAAVNYLVGNSIPATQASTALYEYLHSQPLSAQQQHDVNLAVDGIGPPPNIPAPAPHQKNPKPGPKPHSKCPEGFRFQPDQPGLMVSIIGAKRVRGGWCVPDEKPDNDSTIHNPVLPKPTPRKRTTNAR